MMIALVPPNCVSPALLFGNETRAYCKGEKGRKGKDVSLHLCGITEIKVSIVLRDKH